MKTAIILFSILILFLEAAAAETQIFSGIIITDTNKVIDGGTFRFSYDQVSDKVFVQTPATNMIIENGECKSNSYFRVCINSANFSYKNVTTYQDYYSIDTVIYRLTGGLNISSKISSSHLLPGESAELTITIDNPANFDITKISYEGDLSSFSVSKVTGCSFDGTKITWQGSLKSKYNIDCVVTLTATNPGTYNLAGTVSYFNGLQTDKATNTLAITVLPRQLGVTQTIDKNIEIMNPFYLNISLQNINEEETIDVFVIITLPSNMLLLKDPAGFTINGNTLRLTTILDQDTNKNYSLYLEAKSEGNSLIKQKYDYTIKNVRDVIENNTFANVFEPKPVVNFSSEFAKVKPGQKYIIVAKITNPSLAHEFREINAKLIDQYGTRVEQSLAKLAPNETYAIISNTLIAPENSALKSTNITLNLTIDYKLDKISKSFSKSFDIEVNQRSINTIPSSSPVKSETFTQQAKENKTLAGSTANETKQITNVTLASSSFFDRKRVIYIVIGVVGLFIIVTIAGKLRKKWKPSKHERDAIKEIEDSLNKLEKLK